MKNKAFITIGLILFFSALIVVKNWKCSSVPALEGWYEPADGIEIKGKDLSIVLVKKDNNWLINEQEYPGDAGLIDSIERKARDFKLLDLVSDRGYYDKYDLTDENGVSVIVKGKGKVLRKLIIGKAGSTNNHSYVKVDDRKEIYLASGIMKSDFVRKVGDLRNKNIFDVKKSEVQSFSITYGGESYNFMVNPSKGDAPKEDGKDNKESGKSGAEPKWICREYPKVKLNDSSIDGILQVFSPMKASEFPEKAERKNAGSLICKAVVARADKKIELEIYSNKDNNMNYASSPESKYIFTVGSWQTGKLFIKNINDLAAK